MRRPTPHSALSRLDVLVGEWDMWAAGHRAGPVRTEFTWLEGGAFLVQRADPGPTTAFPPEWVGHVPFPTSTITGYDDTADEFTTLYADGRGVARVYRTSLAGGVWKQWRAAPGFHQRFTATVDETAGTIAGAWERSEDGEVWAVDFDVQYVRAVG
ncbi:MULTISPECIES: hypothetical protein [Streptomyces]|uniref:hypothetical protein n=1 Tax=Streptomyces TaxID=1883 RepID=UPI00084BD6E8|nr:MULTISPECIES: hypothetical protein [Streptomyces]TFI20419.1 hypothetical protein E4P36_36700 [Streptomyces sp. 4R-3d]